MNWLRKLRRPEHRWPKYLPGGHLRTTTVAMVILFGAASWLHQAYQPPAPAPTPETAIVPPGFVPDPQYTWVPRTNVQTGESESTTTSSSTTTTSPTETTSPGAETTPTSTSGPSPITTVLDSGGSGPQTFTQVTPMPSTPATKSAAPVTPTTVPPR